MLPYLGSFLRFRASTIESSTLTTTDDNRQAVLIASHFAPGMSTTDDFLACTSVSQDTMMDHEVQHLAANDFHLTLLLYVSFSV